MDVAALLELTPEAAATRILKRHAATAARLPEHIEGRESLIARLTPLVEQAVGARDDRTGDVKALKDQRQQAHARARELREQVSRLREQLEAEGRLVNPDPKWAREKLDEGLKALERRLETEAMNLESERRILREMHELVRGHEAWVGERKEQHADVVRLRDLQRGLTAEIERAQVAHEALVLQAGESDEYHAVYRELEQERQRAIAELHRAQTMRDQLPSATAMWQTRLQQGFGASEGLAGGDLLAAAAAVERGEPARAFQDDRRRPGRRREALSEAANPDEGEAQPDGEAVNAAEAAPAEGSEPVTEGADAAPQEAAAPDALEPSVEATPPTEAPATGGEEE